MKVLITGISGSGGSFVAEHFAQKPGVSLFGISRWRSGFSSQSHLSAIKDKVELFECDLLDLSSVLRSLEKSTPDAIVHLASHANVRSSFDNPLSVLENNIRSTANLLEALRVLKMAPKFLMGSTSEVYGQVKPNQVPIDEQCALNPVSPYAVSKVTQDMLAHYYFVAHGLPVVRTRMFTYINPRRSDLFATSFALQIAEIEAGKRDFLSHGNLDSIRTLLDVRDAAEAYWLALNHGVPGEVYNIGGSFSLKVGEFLDMLCKRSKMKIQLRADPNLMRAADVTLQIPNVKKFFTLTKWQPKYSIDESIDLLLKECRDRVRAQI